MKKAVAFSCPSKSCHCGLVRNADQENIKMVLERVNMLSVHGSHRIWQQVEQDGPPDSQRTLPGFPHRCWGFSVHLLWCHHSPPPNDTRCKIYIIARDHPLAYLPNEDHLVPLSSRD